MGEVSMDVLCRMYVKMRDKKHAIQRGMEAKVAEIDAQMTLVAAEMKASMQALGVNSAKTDHGTAYLQTKVRFYPQDWNAFSAWVKEHDALELLERRVSQKATADWIRDHPDMPPHGVAADSEIVITVRKA